MSIPTNNYSRAVHSFKVPIDLLLLGLILFSGSGCVESKSDADHQVRYTGALRSLMAGDLQATSSLDSLTSYSNLYALGAQEGLRGEIQIFGGESFNSYVDDGTITLDREMNARAALLVYSQVDAWRSFDIPSDIATKAELEAYVKKVAAENNISTDRPFPFLLEGRPTSLSWHVIDWVEGDTEHSPAKHKNSGLQGRLNDQEVDIIGFYSQHHQTIFTHHSTYVHMHFKTKDGQLAGHVDDLQLSKDLILKLPKQ